MVPPFHTRLRYTEPMVRSTVRTFMWRRLVYRPWLLGLALGLIAVALFLPRGDDAPYLVAALTGTVVALVLLVLVLWRAHFTNTVGRFRALDPPEADLTLDDAGLTVSSNCGASTLPWTSFTEVWVLPDCWMLFLSPAQFMTIPIVGLSPEAESFLRGKLPMNGVRSPPARPTPASSR